MLFKVDPIKAKLQDTQADAKLCDRRCNIPQFDVFLFFIHTAYITYNMETQCSMCEYEYVCVCVCLYFCLNMRLWYTVDGRAII